MKVIYNETNNICEIWVSNSNQTTYKQNPDYQQAVQTAKEKKYRVCTFLSGKDEVLPIMHSILNAHESYFVFAS